MPLCVQQWRRLKGSISPQTSPDLKLWHRCMCVLLSYIFLIGPEAFLQFAQSANQYSQLSTAAWGNTGDVFSYVYDENGSQAYKVYADVPSIETMTPATMATWLAEPANLNVPYEYHTYNLQNRLEQVDKYEYDTTRTLTSSVDYRYNPQGIRIRKDAGGGLVTDYLIDPANLTGYAQVIEETTGATVTRYLIGDDILAQKVNTNTQYLFYDGHGSTRQLVDASGVVINAGTAQEQSYSYDGYGVMLSDSSGAEAASNAATNLLYTGEQYDSSLNQYYLRARYYNPLNGLFNQMDPYAGNAQDPQSLHKYLYCHNNPVNGIDPTGMMNMPEMNISLFIQSALVVMNAYSFVMNTVRGSTYSLLAIRYISAGRIWDGIALAGAAVIHFGFAVLSAMGLKAGLNMPPPPALGCAVAATGSLSVRLVWRLVVLNPDFAEWLFECLAPALLGNIVLAASRDPHHADWELRESNGQIKTRGNEVSGCDEPPGRTLSWQEQLFTHTERKIMNKLIEMAKPGDIITIRGTKSPCQPGCMPAMKSFAEEHGIKIMYEAEGKVWVFQ